MTDHETRDLEYRDLDTLLSESSRATSTHGPERTAALEAMVREAPTGLNRRGRRRLRAAVVSAVGIAALGFGGTAAADSLGWNLPWTGGVAQATYTLPSGALCTVSVLNFEGQPDAVAAAEAFVSREDLLDVIDVGAAITEQRKGPNTYTLADGTKVDAGPGTAYSTADLEYEMAFNSAVNTAMTHALTAEGYDLSGMTSRGTLNCPDADLPAYMGPSGD
jgi:hypothetical protein